LSFNEAAIVFSLYSYLHVVNTSEQIQTFHQALQREFSHEPTEEQAELLETLSEFTFADEKNGCFLLKGYAGTGKTTIMGAYIRALKQAKRMTVLMAPTGRAAKVLSSRAKQPASTIHRKIYFAGANEEGVFKLNLVPNKLKNAVFIIDEASMISDYSLQADGSVSRNLLDDLMNYIFMGENNKVVFLGDEGQLPPVGSDESPVLSAKHLESHFSQLDISVFGLVDVVRQEKESGILFNATTIRTAQRENNLPILDLKSFRDVKELQGDELISEIESCYDKFGSDEVMIVTRSNKRANLYNQHIRNRILYMEEELCGGDLLMVVKNNYFWLDPLSPAGFIANGELIRVHRLKRIEEVYGLRFAQLEVSLVDYPEMDRFEVMCFMDSLTIEQPNLNREYMKQLFFEIEKDYAHIRNKQKRYKEVLQSPYFNALQIKFAYAVTCHKAQGGQWGAVFVDHGYVEEDQVDLSFLRWLYTATTRATEQLYFVQLMDKLK